MSNIQIVNEVWWLPCWDSTIHVVVREYEDGTMAYNLAKGNPKNPTYCHRSFIEATQEEIDKVIKQQAKMCEMQRKGAGLIEILDAVFA